MKRLLLVALLAPTPVAAEVKSSGAGHFEVERKAVVNATPAEIHAQLGRIAEWWNPEHSYSGKAQNLRMDLQAGGCFCETLDGGGSIEHLRIVYADPANGVRATGGLGPLQMEAVSGVLAWSFKRVEGGTEITQNYYVSGSARAGLEGYPAIVDGVLGQQFDRLVASLSK